jgi:hypothetical protein
MQLLQAALSNSSDIFRNSLAGNQQSAALSPGAAIGQGLGSFGNLLTASGFGQSQPTTYTPKVGNPGFSIPASLGPIGPLSGGGSPGYGGGINDPLSSYGINWGGFGGFGTPPTFPIDSGTDPTSMDFYNASQNPYYRGL